MVKNKFYKYHLLYISLACLIAGLSLEFIFKGDNQDSALYTRTICNNLSAEITNLQKELVPVIEHLEKEELSSFTTLNQESAYPFYIFKNDKLDYWSDYRYIPQYRELRGDYRLKFIRTLRKDFLCRQWEISGTDFTVYGLIPLYDNYKIDNNYVRSGFNESIFPDQHLALYELNDEEGAPICLKGNDQCYFKISFDENYVQNRIALNIAIGFLLASAIISFCIFLYTISIHFGRKRLTYGVLVLSLGLILVRVFMLVFNYPDSLIYSQLFDSRYFASSSLNPSLGDLFLNLFSVLIIAIFIFNNYYKSQFLNSLFKLENNKKKVVAVLLGGLLPLLLHCEFLVFQTIYHNSQITFDINQTIRFDGNRAIGFTIFILLSAIIFLLHHPALKILTKLYKRKNKWLFYYIIGLLLFSLVNLLIGQHFYEVAILSLVWIILLRLTNLPNYLSRIRYNTFLYIFLSIIVVSLIGTISVHRFEGEREHDRKQKFANQFLIENDNLAEYLLAEVNKKVREDVFIQSRMSSPFLSKEIIKSKIRQVYLSNYFDKYDVKIYLYNSNGQPFENTPGILDAGDLKKFNVDEYKTVYDGVYFINKLGGEIAKRYLDFIEIKKRGISVGFIIMDLNLKRIIPENVYPELLVDNRFLFPYQDANYSYAVFNDKKITYHSGDYNYLIDFTSQLLENNRLFDQGIDLNGYSHLAVTDPEGRIIVISSQHNTLTNLISNFSFLFLIQVFMLLLLTTFYALYFSFQHVSLNYSARIQLYLNIAFFLPLFAVSITTLSLINSSFKKEINEEYYRKAQSISSNVSDDLNDYVNNLMADREELPNKLSGVAKFSGVDVNLFSTRGKLIATSQPLIYENNLLSTYINPEAFAKIKEQGENSFITKESVGTLEYNTTFYGVKSFDTGTLIGMLSIPFFQSEYALEQNQIEVLTNVINIFTVIFIIFLLVSYLAAKWLTFPLAFITQKLKKTTLTGFNEPLSWKSDDEIGLMVGEYNKMLVNLEESKKALARSQKETAWREIAQQVAHEIKNPLTPMKLTLQHLSRKIKDTQNDKEMEKPISSLLHQVDTLNDIASSFSSFAKMPMPENERYELTNVLKKTIDLHANANLATISLQMPQQQVYTIGDEQLMSRIISNLILNSIQSRDNENVHIDVRLSIINNVRILLEVTDDGSGIDEEIHGKIFMPNFSTKDTGSGIGLAIAKHGVEHAGGKIWFETEEEKGTSFYIELLMVN